MTNDLVSKVISNIAYIGITSVFGIVGYYFKKFITKHGDFIKSQEELVKTQIGTEQYNKNKSIAVDLIYEVEQLGKEFDFDSKMKHFKATKLISENTNLSSSEIFNIIKSTVGKINEDRKNSIANVVNKDDTVKEDNIVSDIPIDKAEVSPIVPNADNSVDVTHVEVKPVEQAVVDKSVQSTETPVKNVVNQDIIDKINELQNLVNNK